MTHINAIGTDDAVSSQKAWRKMLFSTACESYKLTCGQETPRQIKAFAMGWQRLTSHKEGNDIADKNPKEEDA